VGSLDEASFEIPNSKIQIPNKSQPPKFKRLKAASLTRFGNFIKALGFQNIFLVEFGRIYSETGSANRGGISGDHGNKDSYGAQEERKRFWAETWWQKYSTVEDVQGF